MLRPTKVSGGGGDGGGWESFIACQSLLLSPMPKLEARVDLQSGSLYLHEYLRDVLEVACLGWDRDAVCETFIQRIC
eukprot:scaffold2367_cov122-Isochrysis_galbana.AAC.2